MLVNILSTEIKERAIILTVKTVGFLARMDKQLKIVLAWAQINQDELMQNWELMKNRKEPNTIKPIS